MAPLLTALLRVVAPHGGQARARRNAWVGMVEGSARGRAHREAVRSLAAAEARADARGAHPSRAAR